MCKNVQAQTLASLVDKLGGDGDPYVLAGWLAAIEEHRKGCGAVWPNGPRRLYPITPGPRMPEQASWIREGVNAICGGAIAPLYGETFFAWLRANVDPETGKLRPDATALPATILCSVVWTDWPMHQADAPWGVTRLTDQWTLSGIRSVPSPRSGERLTPYLVRALWAMVPEPQRSDPTVKAYCHDAWRGIGERLLKEGRRVPIPTPPTPSGPPAIVATLVASQDPSTFLRLGHFRGIDTSACWRFGGERSLDKFTLATSPNAVVWLLYAGDVTVNPETGKVIGSPVARAWGWLDPSPSPRWAYAGNWYASEAGSEILRNGSTANETRQGRGEWGAALIASALGLEAPQVVTGDDTPIHLHGADPGIYYNGDLTGVLSSDLDPEETRNLIEESPWHCGTEYYPSADRAVCNGCGSRVDTEELYTAEDDGEDYCGDCVVYLSGEDRSVSPHCDIEECMGCGELYSEDYTYAHGIRMSRGHDRREGWYCTSLRCVEDISECGECGELHHIEHSRCLVVREDEYGDTLLYCEGCAPDEDEDEDEETPEATETPDIVEDTLDA